MMSIRVVLFDADGVIQAPVADWEARWAGFVGGDEVRDGRFLDDIFAAETPFLKGGPGFTDAIAEVLERWECTAPIDEVLAMWTMIEPAAPALELVGAVRASGIPVGLATNQHPHRIEYMRSVLGYGEAFDHFFVSCEMGVAKPDVAYFSWIMDVLGGEAHEVLFLDDNESNVSAARAVGLSAERFHLDNGVPMLREHLRRHQVIGAA